MIIIGEVSETKMAYKPNPKDDDGNNLPLGSIMVRIGNQSIYDQVRNEYASPATFNKRIPLIGEHVILLKASTNYVAGQGGGKSQYIYLCPYNNADNVTLHHLPKSWIREKLGLATKIAPTIIADKEEVGYTFNKKSKITKALQPFEGDDLWEGRFGQSIRFTREPKMNNSPGEGIYQKKQWWKAKAENDPMMILKVVKPKSTSFLSLTNRPEYDLEDLGSDDSNIYLTTTQKLTKFKAGSKVNTDVKMIPNWNKGSQVLISSDRIVLNAKTDKIFVIGTEAVITGDSVLFQSKNHKVNLDDLMEYIKSLAKEMFKLRTGQTMLTTAMGPTAIATDPATITKLYNVDFNSKFKMP